MQLSPIHLSVSETVSDSAAAFPVLFANGSNAVISGGNLMRPMTIYLCISVGKRLFIYIDSFFPSFHPRRQW